MSASSCKKVERDADAPVAAPDEDTALRQHMDNRGRFGPGEADIWPTSGRVFGREERQATRVESTPEFAAEREDMPLDPFDVDRFQIFQRIVEDCECQKGRIARLEARGIGHEPVCGGRRDAPRARNAVSADGLRRQIGEAARVAVEDRRREPLQCRARAPLAGDPHRDATVLEAGPRINVGGVFDVLHDDIIAVASWLMPSVAESRKAISAASTPSSVAARNRHRFSVPISPSSRPAIPALFC